MTTTTTTTLHYTRLHCTTLHYTTLHYTRLHSTTLQHATLQHATLHYITLHYTHYTTPQLQLQLHHTYYTTLQLELQLHYTRLHPADVGEVTTATIATTPKKTQLQPPFGPSVDSLCHPCITTTHPFYSVLSLKLPSPPCAGLLVHNHVCYMIHHFPIALYH